MISVVILTSSDHSLSSSTNSHQMIGNVFFSLSETMQWECAKKTIRRIFTRTNYCFSYCYTATDTLILSKEINCHKCICHMLLECVRQRYDRWTCVRHCAILCVKCMHRHFIHGVCKHSKKIHQSTNILLERLCSQLKIVYCVFIIIWATCICIVEFKHGCREWVERNNDEDDIAWRICDSRGKSCCLCGSVWAPWRVLLPLFSSIEYCVIDSFTFDTS